MVRLGVRGLSGICTECLEVLGVLCHADEELSRTLQEGVALNAPNTDLLCCLRDGVGHNATSQGTQNCEASAKSKKRDPNLLHCVATKCPELRTWLSVPDIQKQRRMVRDPLLSLLM